MTALSLSRLLGSKASGTKDKFYPILVVLSVLIGAAVCLPLFYLLLKTLTSGDQALEILLRWRTLEIIGRSLALAGTVTLFSCIISLPLAWILLRSNIKLRKFWLILSVIPMVIPSYVGAFVLVAALGPKGMFQDLLSALGVHRLPEIYGFWGSVVVLTVLRYPYMLLPVIASLSKLDVTLEEASQSLGHGKLSTFYRVVLPQLKWAILTGCVFTALTVLSDFGAVSLLRYETFTWAIYVQYVSAFNFDIAAVLSIVVLLIAFILVYAESAFRQGAASLGSSRVSRGISLYTDLGRFTIPAYFFLIILFTLSIIVPSYVLMYWLYLGITSGQTFPNILSMTLNSLSISIASGLVIVAAAFPIAYLSARYKGKLVRALDMVTHVGYALPGIVVALSLVYFGIRLVRPLYQTYAILIAAYVILFIPICIGTMRNLILQINPNLEDAARSLGKSPLSVIAKITIPLIKPGIAAGFILSFLLTMRELPSTLILSPLGFRTLATGIWSATSETFLAQAAAYSLVLILTASFPMIVILSRRVENE